MSGVCGEGSVAIPAFSAPSADASCFLCAISSGPGLIVLCVFGGLLLVGGAFGFYVWRQRRLRRIGPAGAVGEDGTVTSTSPVRKPTGVLRRFHAPGKPLSPTTQKLSPVTAFARSLSGGAGSFGKTAADLMKSAFVRPTEDPAYMQVGASLSSRKKP